MSCKVNVRWIRESLNKLKPKVNKIVQIIGEKKFRIAVLILLSICTIALMYSFATLNSGKKLLDISKVPSSYFFIVLIVILLIFVSILTNDIFKQTYIRDNIEKQESIKMELENIKLIKDLGLEINEDKLSLGTKELIKIKHSKTTRSNKPKPSVSSKRKI